ncbi:epoxide hydrolase 4-like isoform X1 [Branchiostoma floridae x Branchiostoma japonicum]
MKYMSVPRSVVTVTVVYTVAMFWGVLVLLGCLVRMVRKGPKAFFTWNVLEGRPRCLDSRDLGIHGYVRLKRSGIQLHYVRAGDDRKKPLMVLLHGLPEIWYSWRHQLREFKKDYQVVAVDMRGYGESEKPAGRSAYRLEYLVEDIREVIETFNTSCVLVGHDWGGAVAWYLAMEYPNMVDRLVVMSCPHPGVFMKYVSTHPRQFLKSWFQFFFQLPFLPELVFKSFDYGGLYASLRGRRMGCKTPDAITDEDYKAYKYFFSKPNPMAVTGPFNYLRANFGTIPLVDMHGTDKVTVPCLLIWGELDGALDVGMGEMSHQLAPNMTFRVVEGASHWVQQDNPAVVNTYMREFLQPSN